MIFYDYERPEEAEGHEVKAGSKDGAAERSKGAKKGHEHAEAYAYTGRTDTHIHEQCPPVKNRRLHTVRIDKLVFSENGRDEPADFW